MNRSFYMGGTNARYQIRLGEYLRALYSHPLLTHTSRPLIRAALRRTELVWHTVAYQETRDDRWTVTPQSYATTYEWHAEMNRKILAGEMDKSYQAIHIRRVYVCPLPCPSHVFALIEYRGLVPTCKCGAILSIPRRLVDFDADEIECDTCFDKTSQAQRKLKRAANRHYAGDVDLAHAAILLAEIKKEVRERTRR